MNSVMLRKLQPNYSKTYVFDVPASKSISNRVVLLSALSKGTVRLRHGPFADDTHALLSCFASLGIKTEEEDGVLVVHGCNGNIPNKQASLNVMSAGTVARFLPAVLAVAGGDYYFDASNQMKKRPMDFLPELIRGGVRIDFFEEYGHYPFRMHSDGIQINELTVDTDTSTQYASALLIASLASKKPLAVRLTGSRVRGSYINMTLALINKFGATWDCSNNVITVEHSSEPPKEFAIGGDVSAACYFYAVAMLFGLKVMVRHIRDSSLQGDMKFIKLLAQRGVIFTQTDEGLLADASRVATFAGFDENFCDFSDQVLTAAALAPFAATPSHISGIEHIRAQECDRVNAIVENLTALGVPVMADSDTVTIYPSEPKAGTVRTYDDHRVAMSFALAALRTGEIVLDDVDCCRKSFRGYFDELSKLYF